MSWWCLCRSRRRCWRRRSRCSSRSRWSWSKRCRSCRGKRSCSCRRKRSRSCWRKRCRSGRRKRCRSSSCRRRCRCRRSSRCSRRNGAVNERGALVYAGDSGAEGTFNIVEPHLTVTREVSAKSAFDSLVRITLPPNPAKSVSGYSQTSWSCCCSASAEGKASAEGARRIRDNVDAFRGRVREEILSNGVSGREPDCVDSIAYLVGHPNLAAVGPASLAALQLVLQPCLSYRADICSRFA